MDILFLGVESEVGRLDVVHYLLPELLQFLLGQGRDRVDLLHQFFTRDVSSCTVV